MALKSMKPRLLFISPVLPSPDGPGLAMRPYYQIVSLSQIYSIHLLVAGSFPANATDTAHIKPYCDHMDYLYRYRYSGWKLKQWRRSCRLMDNLRHLIKGNDLNFLSDSGDRKYLQHDKTLAMIANTKFDRVHVFRLYLNSIAEILKEHGLKSFYSLDIDDIESETQRSISGLFSRNRDFIRALRLKKESTIYFNVETKSLPAYDQIFTCSRQDKETLQNRFPDKVITVLPNVVSIPPKARSHKPDQVLTILFVGTMGYYPNTDALLFFAGQIAPILRKRCGQQWHLRVVGTPPQKKWIRRLKHFPEIKLSGFVKDLYPEYEAADIVVAPIRGGGGTRIKILEAFAHGVPVVSTSKGVEGLDVENGVHLFIEDDAGLFADACIRLMNDSLMRDEISRRAFGLAASQYSPEIINHIWAEQLPNAHRS
jgi:glycosyltransferase involved in cell wall biosynthesis